MIRQYDSLHFYRGYNNDWTPGPPGPPRRRPSGPPPWRPGPPGPPPWHPGPPGPPPWRPGPPGPPPWPPRRDCCDRGPFY